MSDLTFSITGNQISGGTQKVQQGKSCRVFFTTESALPVTVQVVGEPGSRPGDRNPVPASLFIDGSTSFTVVKGTRTEKTIGATPNRGLYRLSATGAGGPGFIEIHGLDFDVDDTGKISGDYTVTQGAASHLSYTNKSSRPQQITVRVASEPGGGGMATAPASLFSREQRAMTTINLEGDEKAKLGGQLGPSPDLGTYELSNAPGGHGTIKVLGVKFIIDGAGRIRGDGFNVRQGAELTVTFENQSGKPVTVYVFPDDGSLSPVPLFKTGGPIQITDGRTMFDGKPVRAGIETITVDTTATAVLSANEGPLANFTVSTSPSPCSGGWINHQPPM
jgi:hypothetical protein